MERISELAHRQPATSETSQPPSNLSTISGGFVQPTLAPREPHLPSPARYSGDPGTCLGFLNAPLFLSFSHLRYFRPVEDSVYYYSNVRTGALLGYGSLGATIRHLLSSGGFHGKVEEGIRFSGVRKRGSQ